jgi:hypothetical protein
MVMMTGSLSVRGTVVWLTPQQGGRVSGPPALDYDYDYTATAFLPPRTAADGQAGIALRGFAPGAWRSMAEGFLVADENTPVQHVWPGCVVVVTEGERPVAYFSVEEIQQFEQQQVPEPEAAVEQEVEEITELPVFRPPAVHARWDVAPLVRSVYDAEATA